ncbi:MAG TPA: asparagine synthase (glutamine-hydrolyzing) [Chthoniobacteraceae bacterium]|nr:asparagine synthase (glutamine-hydrolyzing) [Chthoniobacteraceae bacterium]
MCGIAGLWLKRWLPGAALSEQAQRMASVLTHRGPDDAGAWIDEGAAVGMGFRRLAVLDLSSAGRQPMRSHSGRYVITFNGEVYNFRELRAQLEGSGCRFRGNSDTEVVLEAIEAWGLRTAVGRFIGMYAFAVWDRRKCRLSLVRDRLGIKPLYYGWSGEAFLWGSELKALKAHPSFCGAIDRNALCLFLRHSAVPAPYSIYQGVRKLPPGSLLTIEAPDPAAVQQVPEIYWSARSVVQAGARDEFPGSAGEAADRLDALLNKVVCQRMVANVPVGAFLSGGIDSSLVVALMQRHAARRVKTFSIGFDETGYNEAPEAHEVALHLGTDHHELYVTPEQAREMIPLLPEIFDEPFSDSSQIPTCLVSRLARGQVTVSLSGDGGDELFAGYPRYLTTAGILKATGWMPVVLRRSLAGRLPGVRGKVWRELLGYRSAEALYFRMVSHWKHPSEVVIGGSEPPTTLSTLQETPGEFDLTRQMMFADLAGYLADDILVKVDRASMAYGLEARVPLLDHRVVAFAASIPASMKIRQGRGKWLLRQVLNRYVPPGLTERPKMGFGVPIGKWLRGPLRDWAEELLAEHRLQQEGYFHPQPIRRIWTEHLNSTRDWQYYLWDILMFQAWLEAQGNPPMAPTV